MVIDLDFWGGLEIFRDFAPPLEIVEIFKKVEMLTPKFFPGHIPCSPLIATKKISGKCFPGMYQRPRTLMQDGSEQEIALAAGSVTVIEGVGVVVARGKPPSQGTK